MTLLMFTGPHCAACKAIEPFVMGLGVEVRKVDITVWPEDAAKHRVTTLPTFVLVDDAIREHGRVSGADRSALRRLVTR